MQTGLGASQPGLILASQNRSAGNYGNGKGTAALDSLKESGDLEYAADVMLFLTEAQERLATPRMVKIFEHAFPTGLIF
jgi:hypothetical protein